MDYKNCLYETETKSNNMKEVVNVPISLSKSLQGKYFVGQSEGLWVEEGVNAWAGLFNPHCSGVESFSNVITISNFSNQYLSAEIWLNANFSEKGKKSNKISSSNVALKTEPDNKVNIRYMKCTEEFPEGGVNIYDRIVPPNGTLVSEEDGKFIVPSSGNYTIFIKSSSTEPSKVIVAFGWWEEPVNENYNGI